MMPKMSLGAYYDYYSLDYPSIFSSSIGAFNLGDDSEKLYGTRVTMSQPLYTGGKSKTLRKQAAHKLLSDQAQHQAEKNRIIYEVKKHFFIIFYLKKIRTVISNTELQVAKARESALKAEMELQLKREGLNTDMELNRTLHKFNSLVSAEFIESESISDGIEIDETIFDEKLTKLILIAQQNRPEMKGLKAKETIDSLSVGLGKSFKFPNVDLFSTYDYLHARGDEWASNFQVGMSFTFPLYDGGARWSQFMERNALFQKTKILVSAENERIKNQVKQAYQNLVFTKKIHDLMRDRKDSFQLPAKSGVKDIKEWKEVMTNYLVAEKDLRVAVAFLNFSTGSEISKY